MTALLDVLPYALAGRDRRDYRYAGRISLVAGAIRSGWARACRREAPDATPDVDRRGAFTIGLLHGTGAETPTQVAPPLTAT